jgi:hypothetical protein
MDNGLLGTFDPKLVIITFGPIIMTNFADGSFIEISGKGGFEEQQGADGSENRINKNVTGYDVKVTLQQTSITHEALSVAYDIDKLTNQGKQPLTIKDLNGTSLFSSMQAYLKKKPDTTRGNSLGAYSWEFRAPHATYNVGGNL